MRVFGSVQGAVFLLLISGVVAASGDIALGQVTKKAPPPPGKAPPPPVPPGKAQFPPPTKTPVAPLTKAPKVPDKSGPKIPAPKDVSLETKDGVNLGATWYEGTAKKESVPIIMVHGWEGQRGEFDTLARAFQSLGYSTIVPDLRGHGDSRKQKLQSGETKSLEADSLRPHDMEAMAWDIEACKQFLLDKNNAGECNIEMLCVVGSELGSILAMRWAALDWSAPMLPAYKQGQDVKALVLLTPMQAQRGLNVRDALASPAVRGGLSVLLVAGKQDAKGSAEAKRLHNTLQTQHWKPTGDEDEQKKKQDLFLFQPETSLTGTKLLGSGLKVPQSIAAFIDRRLVAKKGDFPWSERKNPLGN